MSRKGFEGWYFRQQKGDKTLAVIPGISQEGAFIQVVTSVGANSQISRHEGISPEIPTLSYAYNAPYDSSQYHREGLRVTIGGSTFFPDEITLDVDTHDLRLTGRLTYTEATPPRGDMMGPFRFLPMECRHSVLSLHHRVSGRVALNGETLDFTGGVGYIEGDSGTSFPERYCWFFANAFEEKASVMVSIASIPLCGIQFTGCIAAVWYGGKEYRMATYGGVRIDAVTREQIVLSQGKLRLIVDVKAGEGRPLLAPRQGVMARTIHECAAAPARVRFYEEGKLVFDLRTKYAGFEWAME